MARNFINLGKQFAAHSKGVPTASLLGTKTINSSLVKITASFARQPTPAQARAAIANMFGNKVSAVQDSFRIVKQNGVQTIMAGFVKMNAVVRPLTEELRASLRQTASNILMDDTDNSVWKVSAADSGSKFITRQLDEDLSELVAMAAPRKCMSVASSPIVAQLHKSANLPYVAFMNVHTASVDYGYLIGEGVVLSSETDSVVDEVSDDLLIDAQDLQDQDNFDDVEEPKDDTAEAAIASVLSMYKAHDKFYASVDLILDGRAAA